MQERIRKELDSRPEVMAWSLAHITSREHQLYAVAGGTESRRAVANEYYLVDVLRQVVDSEGTAGCGRGNSTLLAGDDVCAAVGEAATRAGLVHNPPHGLPEPAGIPQVPLAEEGLRDDPATTLAELDETLRAEVSLHPQVRLTSAEFFAEKLTTHLTNSCGIDAEQRETKLYLEWVLIAERNGDSVESFVSVTRRRVEDIDLRTHSARHAQFAVDLLSAGSPRDYSGPVVLRGEALGEFMNAHVIKLLSSGQAKYKQETSWEIGQPIHKTKVVGDPLTLWANRRLPFGSESSCFDREGLPAQRLLLVRDNSLANYTADQQYAEYLSIQPTGEFGNVEVGSGPTSAEDLLSEPHVEVAVFSWFNANPLTGGFASEIRLGYLVDGDRRTPFKGGMLVGNVLDALANVRWSAEQGFFGDYKGPTTARFGELIVSAGG